MSELRAGVIGVGHLGYHHARIYAATEGVALVGVVDSDAKNGAKAAEDFGTTHFTTVEDLLAAGVDAVSVVVPTLAHHAVARQCIESGVHVLVEKPITATIEEAESLIALAEKHGVKLQVGHIERFNGAVIALVDAIQSPGFMECHRLSPYPNRGHDVSVVLDLMIHDLDIILALDGSEVVSVDAIGLKVFSPSEDIANARIHFTSGCVANLTASRVSVERMRKIRIFDDTAYVSTNYTEQEVVVYRKKPGTLAEGASPMEAISIDALPVTRDEPLKLELEAFVKSVQTNATPLVTGQDGLRALRLAEEIMGSIRKQQAVRARA